MSRFIKGMDIGTLSDAQISGALASFKTLKENGINYIRISIWSDDSLMQADDIEAAGRHKLENSIRIAKAAGDANIRVMLNFYYCRRKEGKWAQMNLAELEQEIYDFTYNSMMAFKEADVRISVVQIGSGLSKGILLPEGAEGEFVNQTRFACAGIRACRNADPGVPLMLHLSDGCDNKMYREWFDNYIDHGEDFEYIGLAYKLDEENTPRKLEHNLNDLALRFGKELVVLPATGVKAEEAEDLLDRIRRVVGYNGAGIFFKEDSLFDENGNPTDIMKILKEF